VLEGARAFLKRGRQSRSADGGGRRSRSSDRRGITRPADDSRRTGTPRASRNAVALNNDRGQSPPLCRKGRVQRDQAQDAREVRSCGPAGRPSPGAITDGRSGRPSPRLQGGARAARSSPASSVQRVRDGRRRGRQASRPTLSGPGPCPCLRRVTVRASATVGAPRHPVQRDQAQDAREVRTCGPAGRPSPGAFTSARSGRPSPRLQSEARAARSSPASAVQRVRDGRRRGRQASRPTLSGPGPCPCLRRVTVRASATVGAPRQSVQRDQAQDAREVRTCGPAGRPSPGAITVAGSGRPSPRLQGGARAARSSPASLAIVGHIGDRGGKGRWPGLATLGRAKGRKSPPISCTGVAASRGRNGGCRRRHASSVHRSIR
jgi:hypothetical protein